ncbi:IS607 family element RNA-guided endonuclease TnpB [Nocardia sp. NPDC058176]|uniref:IS607 family element RNA-guided endonuclease TnpB n=1 Tax=Nocardia sp. NPDC058176 TaxID=3346368 RepID=UPI0036DA2EB7
MTSIDTSVDTALSTPSTIRACVFALSPTPSQARALQSHCGAQRFAYNWGLALVRAIIAQRDAERSYGVTDSALTPHVNWSAYALRKRWNETKSTVAPWWSENSKEAYASGLANLSAALNRWAHDRKSESGRRRAFPRFKPKRSRPSCRFSTGAFGLTATDNRHIKLPRIGVIRTSESTHRLARQIGRGTARIRSATVSFRNGRWQVSFSVEASWPPSGGLRRKLPVIGIDLGITHWAILSTPIPDITDTDGFVAALPCPERAEKKLRRLQRRAARQQGPDKRLRCTPSRRWSKTHAEIARAHTRMSNVRADKLHKLTTRLAASCESIVIEDLHVAGLIRNRRLSARIQHAAWGELRRQLTYKSAASGTSVVVADRFYPSSKTCSGCGVVKTKLPLAERTFHCDHCPTHLDRDINAARNLASLVEDRTRRTSAESCAGTSNKPAGNPHKTDPGSAMGTATGRPSRPTPRSDTTAVTATTVRSPLRHHVFLNTAHDGGAAPPDSQPPHEGGWG